MQERSTGFAQESSDLVDTGNIRIMSGTAVFDDETSAILQSYPKSTLNREENQKEMTLGSN